MLNSDIINRLIDEITYTMGLSETEFDKRKAYLEIEAEDIALLRELEQPLKAFHAELMEEFYSHLWKFDETRAFLTDEETVRRLKQKQARYLEGLTRGEYDWSYVLERLKVGVVHQQVGLQPRWYIGAYSKYLCNLLPRIREVIGGDETKLLATTEALLKVVFLDIELVLDTYMRAERHAVSALKDYAEGIICNMPLGLLVLSEDLRIISANGFLDQFLQQEHGTLKGKSLYTLLPFSGLHDRAVEVLHTGHPQDGIELRLETPAGKTVRVEAAINPMQPGTSNELPEEQARLLVSFQNIEQHEQLVESTQAADARIRAIMDNVADGIITIDENGRVESFNRAAEKMFGYHAHEVIDRNIKMLMPDPYHSGHDDYLEAYLRSGEKRCLNQGFREVEGRRKNGECFPMDLSISELSIAGQRLFIGIVRDITERVEAEQMMMRLSSAMEQTADAIVITDRKGKIEYVNAGFEAITGYDRREVDGKTPAILQSGLQDNAFYARMWKTILSGEIFRDVLVNRKKDGTLYYEEKTITPLRNNRDEISHFVSSGKDITERMHTQKRLQYLAHHDALTALPNRVLFMERLTHAIAQGKRSGSMVAILFMDLDRFKNINDTLGHIVGDVLLKNMAFRLSTAFREGDTVARLSGDEFAILLHDVQHTSDIATVVKKIIKRVSKPFDIEERELFVTTSVGIAVYPHDGHDPHSLLKNADTAMYRAKDRGRGAYCFYTADMNDRAEDRLTLENELRHALDREEFYLEYQPQITLAPHRRLIGVEALLRWAHPQRGTISPVEFIPMLEETGLIISAGQWVVRRACRQLVEWERRGLRIERIAINISPRQLVEPGFADMVIGILHEYGLDTERLELEITESTLMEDQHGAVEVLKELSNKGVSIAMDDFGTGYSSLSYLRRLPIRTLKIDRTFIHDVPGDASDCELIRAVIAMGQNLNLHVLAEGVETEEQLSFLLRYGCHAAQGFLISKPVSADDIDVFV